VARTNSVASDLLGGDPGPLRSLVVSMHEASGRKRLLECQLEGLVERLRLRHPTETATCVELAELGFLFLQVSRSSDLAVGSELQVPEQHAYGRLPLSVHAGPSFVLPECLSFPSLNLRSESDSNGPVPQPPKLNPSIPADHSLAAIDGEAPEKGWTDEIMPGAVTDSVEILAVMPGGGRSVTYIGPGLLCN
jgi:hypothetical protein